MMVSRIGFTSPDFGFTDIKGRTALHYASSADFDAERTKQVVEKCVETLLRQVRLAPIWTDVISRCH